MIGRVCANMGCSRDTNINTGAKFNLLGAALEAFPPHTADIEAIINEHADLFGAIVDTMRAIRSRRSSFRNYSRKLSEIYKRIARGEFPQARPYPGTAKKILALDRGARVAAGRDQLQPAVEGLA